MGSYNYLGFAENRADFLKTVADKTSQYGVGVCSTRQEMGEFFVNVQLYRSKQCMALDLSKTLELSPVPFKVKVHMYGASFSSSYSAPN